MSTFRKKCLPFLDAVVALGIFVAGSDRLRSSSPSAIEWSADGRRAGAH